ncbi:MAG: glucose 1-dehydrogenase [Verrucomicrobiota bacterium]
MNTQNPTSLENKVALVTGGTSGIGRDTALTLALAGAKVVVTGRREAEGAETVRLIEEAGGTGHFVRTDVKQEADIQRAVDETVERFGRLDIAFNNAGVETTGPVTDADKEAYNHIFDVNVWGVLASMKHEIPAMLKNGGGSIVNVSSVAGQVGIPGASIYIGSKHAVEGLTKSTALEYAQQGIRVNLVAPGLIDTDMADRFAGEKGADTRAHIDNLHPVGRSGKPNEVSQAVLWLASDASSFVTGHSLNVDGGWVAQ